MLLSTYRSSPAIVIITLACMYHIHSGIVWNDVTDSQIAVTITTTHCSIIRINITRTNLTIVWIVRWIRSERCGKVARKLSDIHCGMKIATKMLLHVMVGLLCTYHRLSHHWVHILLVLDKRHLLVSNKSHQFHKEIDHKDSI